MRILFDDFAKSSTVSSLYETDSYPASNLIDVFLDTVYISALPYDTVTIDLGADKQVDSIYLAGCTAAFVDFELVNAASSVVYTTTKNITREVDTVYFETVTCRYINFTVDISNGYSIWYKDGGAVQEDSSGKWVAYDASSPYVKIKGCGVGKASAYDRILQSIVFGAQEETTYSRSKTGQVLRNQTPSFKSFQIQVPALDYQSFKTISKSLEKFGIHYPTYFDFTEDTVDFTDPIYAEISEKPTYTKNNNTYIVTIPILEAR